MIYNKLGYNCMNTLHICIVKIQITHLCVSSVLPFSLESNFTPNILTRMEAMGIHFIQDSSNDLQEMEKVLLHWSDGLIGDRPPCWGELLRVLTNVGLVDLSKKINDLLQGMYIRIMPGILILRCFLPLKCVHYEV